MQFVMQTSRTMLCVQNADSHSHGRYAYCCIVCWLKYIKYNLYCSSNGLHLIQWSSTLVTVAVHVLTHFPINHIHISVKQTKSNQTELSLLEFQPWHLSVVGTLLGVFQPVDSGRKALGSSTHSTVEGKFLGVPTRQQRKETSWEFSNQSTVEGKLLGIPTSRLWK